jgi:hypothetical protein
MYQRDHQRSSGPSHAGLPRRAAHPVVALQRLIGNRGTTRLLARDKKKNAANFARSVQFGKFGPIEVKSGSGNVEDWLGTASPDNLDLTTVKGKHSDELKQLSGSKTRIDKLVLSAVSGQNTMVTITLSHVLVKNYTDDGKTESWRVTDYDAAHRDKVSIGAARP